MGTETARNIKVGLLVVTGTLFLIIALYTIGNKQNFFGSTFRVSAKFHNVSGLMEGNNVRFAGIDVGTVEKVEIVNDSSVDVTMVIEKRVQPYIKKNAVVNVGTDGLMGNKLVNINSAGDSSPMIEDGDVLVTVRPVETDEMLRTLNQTNNNVSTISENLKQITQKVSSPNTLWSVLMDTVLAENIKVAIANIKTTGDKTSILAGDLGVIVKNVKSGKGSIGSLLNDTIFSNKLQETVLSIKSVGDSLSLVAGDLRNVSLKIKKGEGAVGTFLMDTTFTRNLNQSLENIKMGSQGFSENMEALKHNFLFRNYYKDQGKEKKKAEDNKNKE
ncbi:MAG: MCE family protein [Bacteroidetes bacterium]|nr:MCE family protein [Bacteroidota bacterium]